VPARAGRKPRHSSELADVRVDEHDVHLARRRDHHTCMLLSVRWHVCAFVYVHKLVIAFKFNTKNKTQKYITKFSFSTNVCLLLLQRTDIFC
jgi:hypothetical protein